MRALIERLEVDPRLRNLCGWTFTAKYRVNPPFRGLLLRLLVEKLASLQQQGVRVSAVLSLRDPTPMISNELHRQADNFIDLKAMQDVTGRPLRDAST